MELAVLLPFSALFLLFAGVVYVVNKLNGWTRLPDYSAGALCTQCDSANLNAQPLWGKNSLELVYVCQDCKTKAYRNVLPAHDD